MRLSPGQIAEVIMRQARVQAVSKLIRALAEILRKSGRLRDLPLIQAAVRTKLEDLGLVTVETAHPLAEADQAEIRQAFKVRQPQSLVIFQVNPQLGDGFRLTTKGRVVDASLAETLRRLSHFLVQQGGSHV